MILTANHHLLLDKMNDMGLRGIVLQWCSSYVNGRKQIVVLPDTDDAGYLRCHLSSEALIEREVPQGSVFGPLLFLLCINDLPSFANVAKVCLFADDTSLSSP